MLVLGAAARVVKVPMISLMLTLSSFTCREEGESGAVYQKLIRQSLGVIFIGGHIQNYSHHLPLEESRLEAAEGVDRHLEDLEEEHQEQPLAVKLAGSIVDNKQHRLDIRHMLHKGLDLRSTERTVSCNRSSYWLLEHQVEELAQG